MYGRHLFQEVYGDVLPSFQVLLIFMNLKDIFLSTRHELRCWAYGTWYSTVSVTFAFAWYLIPEKKVKLGPPWILFEEINNGDLGQNFFEVLLLIVLPWEEAFYAF